MSDTKPDERYKVIGPHTIQAPIIGFREAKANLGGGITGPMFEVILEDRIRLIPADPTSLEKFDPENISENDMVEISGTTIGDTTENLIGKHVKLLDTQQQQKTTEYATRKDPRIPGGVRASNTGKTVSIKELADRASQPGDMSASAKAAMDRLSAVIPGLYAKAGDYFKAPVNGSANTNLHLQAVKAGNESEASATMQAGGSKLGAGLGGVSLDGAAVENSCMPEQARYSHLNENPLINTLGPSTTMNPFPPYMINVGKFLIGIYAITKAIGSFPEGP